MFDEEARYRAVQGRDARFDGVFYLGVTSTGIYCRPSCPAMTPKRANIRYFRTAAQAQSAGFRACRRCRPDATPGSAEWNIRADVVGRAMRLIGDGVVDRDGVAGLARRLGYSERQIHRTLVEEVGAGPLRLARTQRAHTARILLETTDMPVTEAAFAAGFASIRQFNDTIREIYAMTPSELRGTARRSGRPNAPGAIDVRLAYRTPAHLDDVLTFLAHRAIPGVEEVEGHTYRRSLTLPHGVAVAELTPSDGWVQTVLWLSDPRDLTAAVTRCRRVFDLDADPQAVDDFLGADPILGPLATQAPGRRVPGTVDGEELAIRAVLGQQVSVASARSIAGRLTLQHGKPLDAPVGRITHTFPAATVLASIDPATFPLPRTRQHTLHELTSRLGDGRLRLDPGVDREDAERNLLSIPGIGPWTARYVRMRALSDPDVFLNTDLGIKRGLERLGLATHHQAIDDTAGRWRPWRSYALMHIWAAAATAATSMTE
jgi:AraC family transcriptional regulator of adaptative response / DNA-3-methyladenine glycosylase II